MEKPLIGVVPLWDEKKDSLWMLPGYMEGILQAGGLPLMLPLTAGKEALRQLAGLCAGFLFTGGHDIFPGLYGAEVLPCCGPICEERDAMERTLFSVAVLEQDKSALGICRGIQLFNVLLGGTLYQDLPAQLPGSALSHQQKPPYDRPVHRVKITQGSPLHELLGLDTLEVNSSHHQGIADLAPELVPMARAEDGLIEAVRMKDKTFVWAVQWHPEFAPAEESSRKLFSAFVETCRNAGRSA
ncbi:MAG: gamma-glutamyl-gamma-aminobutyrate hydrolase family protein [Spirochaetaceae bacterium]|jgi:putative glutamine amidotransferase|nr:gamma-glutamyl-gamma-aminobutyrate hydrolase family protein [Spirochaetaceae bacterium]